MSPQHHICVITFKILQQGCIFVSWDREALALRAPFSP